MSSKTPSMIAGIRSGWRLSGRISVGTPFISIVVSCPRNAGQKKTTIKTLVNAIHILQKRISHIQFLRGCSRFAFTKKSCLSLPTILSSSGGGRSCEFMSIYIDIFAEKC